MTRLVIDSNYVTLGQGDRIAQGASASFDAWTFEVWGALLNGGTLVLVERQSLLAPGELSRVLAEQSISILWLTASLLAELAQADATLFQSLDCLLFGGEAADPRCIARLLGAGGPRRLINGYGPTEATTFSLCPTVREAGARVPIGRPISNTRVYILDAWLSPVPVGVVGEIYIAGAGLARSYHNCPDLTAERFVPDPFGGAGGRMYRTGDLGRWRSDGAVEFLGRRDWQVKVRGHRIELGEIAAALEDFPTVQAATVMVHDAGDGDRRLIAYVVPRDGFDAASSDGFDAASLRAQAAERLPAYMLPHHFIALDKLPLSANGKLDRRALAGAVDVRGARLCFGAAEDADRGGLPGADLAYRAQPRCRRRHR